MVRRTHALMTALLTPRGPMRPSFWRSPLRGPWLTAILGSILLGGITTLMVTGLLSYDAYNPRLPGNDETPHHGLLGAYLFTWPTHPVWLYRLNQGVHVTLGLVLVPVLLAKLWSVIPRLFEMPPIRSVAHALERVSLLLLVGGVIFEFGTGIMNVQDYYKFPASFYQLHFYGAWVFTAAFVVHVVLRFPRMLAGLRSRRLRDVLRTDTAHTLPDAVEGSDDPGAPGEGSLVSPAPAPASVSRRGALALVGASSLSILVLTIGDSVGGALRSIAILAPRGKNPGTGPNGFQINRTAAAAGITAANTDESWRLTINAGDRTLTLSRADLMAMPQYTSHLPIACVEGWSSGNQAWSGVRLRDLATMIGVVKLDYLYVESIQKYGGDRAAALAPNQVFNEKGLLALRVNGAELSLDHGYPARVIVPASPGVHNTKWVNTLTFHI